MEPSDAPLYCIRKGERCRVELGGQIRTAEGEVAHRLRKIIKRHGLGTGDKLPSENELSREFKITRDPVRRGLKVLESGNEVESRPGSGWYVL